MRQCDRAGTAALRSAVAAIENAEAVPTRRPPGEWASVAAAGAEVLHDVLAEA